MPVLRGQIAAKPVRAAQKLLNVEFFLKRRKIHNSLTALLIGGAAMPTNLMAEQFPFSHADLRLVYPEREAKQDRLVQEGFQGHQVIEKVRAGALMSRPEVCAERFVVFISGRFLHHPFYVPRLNDVICRVRNSVDGVRRPAHSG